jgi:hypothetical protein
MSEMLIFWRMFMVNLLMGFRVRRKIVGVGERRLGHDCELLVYRNEESIPNDDYDKDRARDYIRPSRLAIWSETTGITLFYVW